MEYMNYYSFIISKTDLKLVGKLSAISYINSLVNCGYGRDEYILSNQSYLVSSIATIILWDKEAANDTQSHIHAPTYPIIDILCNDMKSESIKTHTSHSRSSLTYSSMTQPTYSPSNSLSSTLSITPTDAPVMSAALLIITSLLTLNISPNI